jgi:hypothetical protein
MKVRYVEKRENSRGIKYLPDSRKAHCEAVSQLLTLGYQGKEILELYINKVKAKGNRAHGQSWTDPNATNK